MSEGIPGLAERLDLLFATVPREAGSTQLHTSESVSALLADQGIAVSPAHLSNLRTGRRDNPSAVLLAGIARVFDVPITYFLDDSVARDISTSLRSLAALRDKSVQKVMLRAQGVSPTSIDAVVAVLDQIRRIEGLDAASEGTSD